MSRNNIIVTAICGAVVAAIVANFLGTERGKQALNSASGLLKDLANKATDYAKNSITSNLQNTNDPQHA